LNAFKELQSTGKVVSYRNVEKLLKDKGKDLQYKTIKLIYDNAHSIFKKSKCISQLRMKKIKYISTFTKNKIMKVARQVKQQEPETENESLEKMNNAMRSLYLDGNKITYSRVSNLSGLEMSVVKSYWDEFDIPKRRPVYFKDDDESELQPLNYFLDTYKRLGEEEAIELFLGHKKAVQRFKKRQLIC
jgi:hypothetical protein